MNPGLFQCYHVIYDVSVRCRDKSWGYMMSLCGVGINRGDI